MTRQPSVRWLQQHARAEVKERLIEKPLTPPDFNRLLAPDEQLRSYGIMPKPRDNPVLLDLWEKALSHPQQLKAL